VLKRMRIKENLMEYQLRDIFSDSFPKNGFAVCFYAPGCLYKEAFVAPDSITV